MALFCPHSITSSDPWAVVSPVSWHFLPNSWKIGEINFSLKTKLRWYVVVEQKTSWKSSSLSIVPFVKEIFPSFEATAKKIICYYFIYLCTPLQSSLRKLFGRIINCFYLFFYFCKNSPSIISLFTASSSCLNSERSSYWRNNKVDFSLV